MEQPKEFFHGTQIPVHLSEDHFLNPELSRGGDEGDPDQPHVFLTPSAVFAKIFSLKSGGLGFINLGSVATAIYVERPLNVGTGYVYRFLQDEYQPFVEIVVRGRTTKKWVSFERLDVTRHPPQIVGGVSDLMRDCQLQIFYLRDKSLREGIFTAARECAFAEERRYFEFLTNEIRAGSLVHLNRVMGISPYPFDLMSGRYARQF
jgi:hypothetical protein